MIRLVQTLLVLTCCALLGACADHEQPQAPIEIVQQAPLELRIQATGQLRAARSTTLQVPGSNWSRRQLHWMVPEGSRVSAGELVARFGADDSQVELAKAQVDLLRNALAKAGKAAEMQAGGARIDADLAQVGTDLGIARRYAGADLDAIARNDILDAIQDQAFLSQKSDYLKWRRDQTGQRGAAELAVLDSQNASHAMNAKRRSDDLTALELRAPHDGVVILSANWAGDKPRVGAAMWAGNEFGSLPDLADLEVEFSVPPQDAAGLVLGSVVICAPIGRPSQRIESAVSWIASAAQASHSDNPAKWLKLRAKIPAEAVREFDLVPGQSLSAEVYAARERAAFSVPNVAILSSAGENFVLLRSSSGAVSRRAVQLGERGPARTRVISGLAPGDAVLLTPAADGADT
jgi:hypothetical protein